jgi:hypothetical protein
MFSEQAAFTHREAFAKFPWEKVSYRIIFYSKNKNQRTSVSPENYVLINVVKA